MHAWSAQYNAQCAMTAIKYVWDAPLSAKFATKPVVAVIASPFVKNAIQRHVSSAPQRVTNVRCFCVKIAPSPAKIAALLHVHSALP